MAQIATLRMKQTADKRAFGTMAHSTIANQLTNLLQHHTRCITFGAPTPFVQNQYQPENQKITAIHNWLGQHVNNIVNANDLIPRMPYDLDFLSRLGGSGALFGLVDLAALSQNFPLLGRYRILGRVTLIGYGLQPQTEVGRQAETLLREAPSREAHPSNQPSFVDCLGSGSCWCWRGRAAF